jgi:hypothetical protein
MGCLVFEMSAGVPASAWPTFVGLISSLSAAQRRDSSQFCHAVIPTQADTDHTVVFVGRKNNRMTMLAEQVDGVIGVDTHRDTLAAAAVSGLGAVLAHTEAATDQRGYREVLAFAREQIPGARCWALEGTVSNITTSYDLNVTQPGAVPTIPDVRWSNPREVRCDTTFADNTSTGCVIPSIRAGLTLPLSTYGAAAATYAFAENNFIDEWGSAANPLKRLADPDSQEANRKSTCGTGAARPFVYLDDIVPDDSCDEYPFAATYQGGTNGGLCADIIPQLEDGTWNFYQDPNAPAVTFNEPCVRGHVPNGENGAAGLALGRNSQNERVIDAEPFVLVVTA